MKRTGLVLLVIGLLASEVASASSMIDRLERSTVYIKIEVVDYVQTSTKSGTLQATISGSGFFVADGRHIVTNWHVCCDVEDKPRRESIDGQDVILVEKARGDVTVLINNQYVAARVIDASPAKDLAILELDQDTGRPPVTLVPDHLVRVDQRTIAIGYPGAAEEVVDEKSMEAPSVTEGVISRKVNRNSDSSSLGVASALYQTNTAINHGNSGGPLFDAWGRVVGVNELGISSAEGTNFAIRADEVIALCKRNNITPSIAWLPVLSDSSSLLALTMQALTAALALGAIFFTFTRRGRDLVKQSATAAWNTVTTSQHRRKTEPRAAIPVRHENKAQKTGFSIRGLSGSYAGRSFECGEKPLIIGRDPASCNLLYPKSLDKISKMHCRLLRGGLNQEMLLIEDLGSTNGTFLGNGERLRRGQQASLRNGEKFYLADKENSFEVSARLS